MSPRAAGCVIPNARHGRVADVINWSRKPGGEDIRHPTSDTRTRQTHSTSLVTRRRVSVRYRTLTLHVTAGLASFATPVPSPSTTTPVIFTVNFLSLPSWRA